MPIIFPITYKCNLSCKYCPAKDSQPEPDIDKCLELIKKSKKRWVWITGGEPLLVENIEEICKKIKSFGKKIGITTNGTINNDRIHLFADRVGVSIDGNREYHNIYRHGSYDQAVSFLKNLVGKVQTVLCFTLFEENKKYIDHVKELGKQLNVDYVQIVDAV